jgi:Protein of unknown function (DUF3298)
MFGNVRSLAHAALAACVLVGWSGTGTAGAQSACADLGGTVDRGQACHVHTASSSYTVDFSFPLDYPDAQPLTDYLTQERVDFVNFVQTRPPRGFPYELEAKGTTYRSGTPASGTQSLVFEVYSESGGAHPTTSYHAFNYDLGKGVPITFDTLFKPDTKPLEVLDPIVGRELEKRGHEIPPRFNDLGVKAYQNFAITDDAVIFFFTQGLVLAQVDGPLEVSVPRTELATLLADRTLTAATNSEPK